MIDLLVLIIEVISIPFQFVAELIGGLLGLIFHLTFAKRKLDENGQTTDHRPTNRWQILGYSLIGTVILSLLVGGICLLIWQSWFWAQVAFWVTAFIGVMGAIKAAVI